MHELSIALNIVEIVTQYAATAGEGRVCRIHLSLGSLACVHQDALLFSFDLVTADTPLAGAKLHIRQLPVALFCHRCERLQELPSLQPFRCPVCQTPSADIRQGQELDIDSIEWMDIETAEVGTVASPT